MKFIRGGQSGRLRFELLPAGGVGALSGEVNVLGWSGGEQANGRNLFAHLLALGQDHLVRKLQHHIRLVREGGAGVEFSTGVVIPADDSGQGLRWRLDPVQGDERVTCEVVPGGAGSEETAQRDLLAGCLERVNDLVIITEAEPMTEPGPRIVYVNRAFERRTGYRASEVIGRTPRLLQGPGTNLASKHKIREALTAGKPARVELVNYTKDGKEFWIESDLAPVTNAHGWVTHWVAVQRDITERKLAELAIEVGRERLELAQRVGRLGEWLLSAAMDRMNWSSRLHDMLGVADGTFAGTYSAFLERVHPEDRTSVDSAVRRALETGEPLSLEHRVVLSDGSQHWLHQRAEVVRGSGGAVEQLMGTAQDVTAARQLQMDLENVFVLAFDLIAISGFDGCYREVNPSFTRVLGYAAEELIGRSCLDFVHPEDRAETAAELERLAAGSTVVSHVNRVRRQDGGWCTLQWTSVPDVAGGTFYSVARDITAELEAKRERAVLAERLESTMEHMSDGVLMLDAQWRLVFANGAAEALLRRPRGQLTGRVLWEEFPPTPGSLFRRECERAVLERVPVQFEEMFGERDQWLEVRVFPTEEGVSLFCRDITARRRQEQVQRVNSIGMLAGGMAHDFNNLLTPVALSIGLLQGRLPDAESRATLDAMAACTRRGAEMVNRMLSLSRGAGGRRVAVSVSDLMDDITGIARETFPRGIRVEVSGAGASGWVTGDPAQLRQVVLNLCLNARDAMPEGGVLTVSAVVETLDKRAAAACLDGTPGRFLRLGVRDTGVGMDDATRARLFEPFFTTKGGGNGSGLGLATALGIVKSHGGFFRVDSQPGVGSLFEVFLPASPAPEARPAQEVLPQGVTRGHDELVLVVDDEPAIREITRQTLELSGYRVEVAADGVEGLARFVERRGEVAAVVTDLMMPQMDGHALMRALRNLHPTVPIVATSGVSRRAQDAGCSGVRFLAKPFTAETLTAALHAALTERNTVTQGTR